MISFKIVQGRSYCLSKLDTSMTVMLLCNDTKNRFSFRVSICVPIAVQDCMLRQIMYAVIVAVWFKVLAISPVVCC